MRVRTVAQADAFEELVRPCEALPLRNPLQAKRNSDELLGGQLAGKRAPVVLVGVPERRRPVVGKAALSERAELLARDGDRAGTRPLEPRQDPHQRRLARSARAEDDADLAFLDVERQPLQRGDAAVCSRVNAEEVAGLDEAHVPAS